MEGVALVDGLRPVTFDVEGRPLAGTVLDLTAKGLGWLAEARIDDLFVVEVAVRATTSRGQVSRPPDRDHQCS